MASNVRYKPTTNNMDEETYEKPLTVWYSRFTVLERVLMVALFIIFLLALVLGILYAAKNNQSEGGDNKQLANSPTTAPNSPTAAPNSPGLCLTPACIKASAGIFQSVEWHTDPCHDFYKFSCNKFLESHEIPDSQTSLGQFNKLSTENQVFIRKKLESKEGLEKYSKNEAVAKGLQDYFSCMKAEKEYNGLQRAYSLIKKYGSWNITDGNWQHNSNWQLMSNLINVHRDFVASPFFGVHVAEDLKNSTQHIIQIIQTGNVFITPQGYLLNKTYFIKMRNKYKDVMLTVITRLANTSKDNPIISKQVEDIFNFETQLAKVSMSSDRATKTEQNYKKMSLKELQRSTKDLFNWLFFFRNILQDTNKNVTEDMVVAVLHLDYLKNMTEILRSTDKVVIGNYFMWKVISSMSSFLGEPIRNDFRDYFKEIYHMKQVPPSWQFCLINTKMVFGLPLSLLYVDEKFGKDQMKQVEEMVTVIREIFIENVENITWMDPKTKRFALRKARTIKQNVGYPKILLDQERLSEQLKDLIIDENDYFNNVLRKKLFQATKKYNLLTKPVDKSRWTLNPDATNAYYKASENKIVFPAGVLQPPFFDMSRPKSLNYGAIGHIIGHELTHSFDNRGRHYDENGNLFDWWQKPSENEFKERTKCLVEHYSKYKFRNLQVNAKNNLDENIADTGGVQEAFQAYQQWTDIHGEEPGLPALNFTHNQLFFIGLAQVWCTKYRESVIPHIVNEQRHAPPKIRVLGSLSNFPEFAKAFNCPLGSPMNPRKKCADLV